MPATLIVANLRSGGGRARDVLPLVTNALRRAGREYELIVPPTAEATAPLLAEFLSAGRPGFDQIAVIGGDGTLNEVVNGFVCGPHPGGVLLTQMVKGCVPPEIAYIPCVWEFTLIVFGL